MRVITQLLLVSCTVLLSHSLPPCRAVSYTYHSLALTWPNQFCSQTRCTPSWTRLWDGKSMIIHGFWPSSTDLAYLSCFAKDGYDHYCDRYYPFRENEFSAAEKSDLNKYWPQLGSIGNFWEYEWEKHGTCYLYIMKNKQGNQGSDASLLKQYFLQTINKVKKLNIKLKPGTINTKTQFAQSIGLNASEFHAICGRDNELDEIRICYSISNTPGNEQIIKCPDTTDPNKCEFPIVIR